MIQRVTFAGILGLTWILFFQFCRLIFFFYQTSHGETSTVSILAEAAWRGLRMDVSFAAYLLVIPVFLLSFTAQNWRWFQTFFWGYSILIAGLIALLVTSDLEIFRAWGFRIDTTPLRYLATPQEAYASMSSSPLLFLVIVFLFLGYLIYKFSVLVINYFLSDFTKTHQLLTPVVFLLLTGSLIIPIRGGLQLAPMNQSAVYFSNQPFANQLAVNPAWNFFSALVNDTGRKDNPFETTSNEYATELISSLFHPVNNSFSLLRQDRQPTNVLLIIWESFTAKAVGSLGGLPDITPQFDSLTKEGLLFSSIYASGDRSDKGLVALLSGFPAQPITSIITIPTKTASLPSLPRQFKSANYQTSFYYGGETEFANIKSFLLQQGFDRIVDKKEFNPADMNSKWGAHDHVVFERLLNDLDSQKAPFFSTIFTLSSHEPFEVPAAQAIAGTDVEHKFLNSLHYTDASLGEFIRKAKTKKWWQNTLVIIIADHGHPLPKNKISKHSQFHIPMLWLGGALIPSGEICDSLGSQIDLAATVLGQLHLSTKDFRWSNDLFLPARTPFAYYSFNNGFGWTNPGGHVVFDNIGKRETEKEGVLSAHDVKLGQAYQQLVFADFLNR
ncbi:LTA synthase family protein [Arundinibacter roseus]|uniref:Alkaline phosphatase family protein n=1 Tax=Arundinibacter roseus TaxID=2070510 RepID=A0A4R4KGV9_9BACT|nr:alkaline phosphatase family protein [Arundinibacter roseus]TDB67013.1 alkaline phosphatase family protein [Arundinibacter roseus]